MQSDFYVESGVKRFAGNAVTNPVDKMIGEKIVCLLRERHMTAEMVAVRLGLTVAEFEACVEGRSRFRAQNLFDLSQALNVKVSDLFSRR